MTPSTLNVEEAAKLMNIHPQTVLDLISDGTLPAGKIGRSYILLYKDVMHHIERIIVQQTAARMGGMPLKRSPQLVRQARTAKVGITHQHAV